MSLQSCGIGFFSSCQRRCKEAANRGLTVPFEGLCVLWRTCGLLSEVALIPTAFWSVVSFSSLSKAIPAHGVGLRRRTTPLQTVRSVPSPPHHRLWKWKVRIVHASLAIADRVTCLLCRSLSAKRCFLFLGGARRATTYSSHPGRTAN